MELLRIFKSQKKWKMYFEEVSAFINWLSSNDEYAKIEEICIDIYLNTDISVEDRAGYGAAIFSINRFHNPKANIEEMF